MKKAQQTTPQHPEDDARWAYECEQAFLRRAFPQPDAEQAWQEFRQQVRSVPPKRHLLLRRRLAWAAGAVAAAIVVGLVVAYGFGHSVHPSAPVVLFAAKHTVKEVTIERSQPGFPQESSTVSGHRELRLKDNGAVVTPEKADFSHVKAEAIVETNTVSIPYGQTYRLILSDGTQVWINAGSQLIFPSRFSKNERTVQLTGEAYFHVAPDAGRPFTIQAGTLRTRVLGTEFNIKAYPSGIPRVTLVQGSVQVSVRDHGQSVTLTPGEEATCNGDRLQVARVEAGYCTQWRDGLFYFDHASLPEILAELGRWYGLTVEMDPDSSLYAKHLRFVADRHEPVSSIVGQLNAFGYLSVIREGDKLHVRTK